MGSNWPNGLDNFQEPSIPEDTPLSSAGSGNKNHTEHHRDLGDSIEAMQASVALKQHDHSGASSGDRFHGNKLLQANTHQSADTDVAASSIHHTLGDGPTQAAPGDHTHDYNDGSILNAPIFICTSQTRPLNPQEGTMIWEKDTKHFRVWATFPNNAIQTGLYSVDYFNRVSALNMDPTLWEQWYEDDPEDPDHGRMATPDGVHLSWIDEGADSNRCIARRIHPADQVTDTDDQVITWKTGDEIIEEELILTEGATNNVYFRMSSDSNSYVVLRVGNDYVKWFYTTTGRFGEKHLGTVDEVNTDIQGIEWRAECVDRTFSLYKDGAFVGSVRDGKALTNKGVNNRGWAIGMVAGDRFLGQTTPANWDWVSIQDYVRYQSVARWTLLPIGLKPILRLRQRKAQQLTHTGSLIEWTEATEDTFRFWDSRASTDILVREAGSYRLSTALQWDAQVVPDTGIIIVILNGVETTLRQQGYMRGGLNQPDFSQTLLISEPIRLAAGDILQLRAKFKAPGQLLTQIFSFFDANSRIMSRLELIYDGP